MVNPLASQPNATPIPSSPGPADTPGRPGSLKPYSLLDPISAKKYGVHSIYEDTLLELNRWQSFKLALRTAFVATPKAVWEGLKGEKTYTFSDFLNIAKIPYYLGGAFLVLSFRAGRDVPSALRQGIGVGLYYLGVLGANKAIDAVYKRRYGVDLGLKYRKPNGDIEKVFASADFPRLDLLKPHHYEQMRQKMGIPASVADPKYAVKTELKRIISDSRADKLIWGNLLAAVGAGYLARSDGWLRLIGNTGRTLKDIWRDPKTSGNRLAYTVHAFKGWLENGFREKITGLPQEAHPWLRRSVLGSLAALSAYMLWHATRTVQSRSWESPGVGIPRDAEMAATGGVDGRLNAASYGLFDAFTQARMGGHS